MNKNDFLYMISDCASIEQSSSFHLIINDEGFEASPAEGWQASIEGEIKKWEQRKKNTTAMHKETHGLDELICSLKRLRKNSSLRYFDLLSKNYTGECFFLAEEFIGCAITKRSGGISIPL